MTEKEVDDMKLRAFKACIKRFDALLLRTDLEPEQRSLIELCRLRILELGRNRNPSESEVFRCINDVSERLLKVIRSRR